MEIILNKEASNCIQTLVCIMFLTIFLYFAHSLITSPSQNEIMADKGYALVYLTDVGDSSRPHWLPTNSTEYAQAIQKKLNTTTTTSVRIGF